MFEPTGRYWIFIVVTLALTALIGYATQATARLLKEWKPDRNLLLIPSENILRVALIPLLIGLAVLSGLSMETFGLAWPSPLIGYLAAELGIGLAVGLGMALLFVTSTLWLRQRDGNQNLYSTTIIDAILPKSNAEGVLVGLAMLPSVLLEELLFRSLLMGGLSPTAPALLLLLVTSLLFGSLHSPQGTWGIIGATLAGLIFGALFLWRGNITAAVSAHYVANMVQIGIAARLLNEEGKIKPST